MILFLLKAPSPVLNKGSLGRAEAIRSILFKEATAHPASPAAAILRVTPLRKRSVLEAGIFSSSLSTKSRIHNLVINQLAKFASFKSCVSHVNSPARRKPAKARQKAACNVAPDRVVMSKVDKTLSKTSRVMALRSRGTSSS